MTLNQLDEAIQDTDDTPSTSGFQLHLQNFSGPFDLPLSLIARKQLDVTEVALAEVTDEFLAYVRTLDTTDEVLEQSTSFMVVAATLLDSKPPDCQPADSPIPKKSLRAYWKNAICSLLVCRSTRRSKRPPR